MAAECEVIVAGVVDVLSAIDPGGRTGNSFVQFEKRISNSEPGCAIIDNADLLVTRVQMEAVVLLRDVGSAGR